MANGRENESSPTEEHTEDNKTFGHVEGKEQEDQEDEPTVPQLGPTGGR